MRKWLKMLKGVLPHSYELQIFIFLSYSLEVKTTQRPGICNLSIYVAMYLSVCLFMYLFMFICMYLSIHPSICLLKIVISIEMGSLWLKYSENAVPFLHANTRPQTLLYCVYLDKGI